MLSFNGMKPFDFVLRTLWTDVLGRKIVGVTSFPSQAFGTPLNWMAGITFTITITITDYFAFFAF